MNNFVRDCRKFGREWVHTEISLLTKPKKRKRQHRFFERTATPDHHLKVIMKNGKIQPIFPGIVADGDEERTIDRHNSRVTNLINAYEKEIKWHSHEKELPVEDYTEVLDGTIPLLKLIGVSNPAVKKSLRRVPSNSLNRQVFFEHSDRKWKHTTKNLRDLASTE